MKKLLAIILAAGIFSAGFTGVFAEESTYLTPGNEKDYKWTKIYATEFKALKELGRDESGNVTLDGEIAPTQNYPDGVGGRFNGFQAADGVTYFNPDILWGGSAEKRLLKTEKGLAGYRTGANGYIIDSAILMASSDTTKNAGGSLLPSLNDGEWYKVSFDFFMEDANNANIVALTDTDTDALGGDNVYNCFGLLRLNNNEATGGKNLFGICGETLNDEIFKSNVWFKYNLIFNRRTREIKLTISERDNPQNKAVLNTVLGTGSGWSDGIPNDKVFNALKFTRSGKIGIDNIKVEKCGDIKIAAAYSCDSQEPLNIIAYDGGSPIYFGRINVLTEEYVLDRLEKDGTKIIAYSQLTDGTYQLKINVENIAPRTESPTLCIAYYDKSNRLINIEMQDINITQRGSNKVDVTLSGTAAASRINIMLIGCRNNMAPLSKNINFITFVK